MSAPEDVRRVLEEMLNQDVPASMAERESWHAVLSAYVERTERDISLLEKSNDAKLEMWRAAEAKLAETEREIKQLRFGWEGTRRSEAAEARLSQFAPLIEAAERYAKASSGADPNELESLCLAADAAFPALDAAPARVTESDEKG